MKTPAFVGLVCLFARTIFGQFVAPYEPVVEYSEPPLDSEQRFAVEPPSSPMTPVAISTPAVTNNFLGLGDDNTSIPPDTMGAVGPNHVMTILNTQVRIHDRSGAVFSTTSLSNWWSSAGSFTEVFDPRVLYDPYGGRWIAVAATDSRTASSSLLIAASQTDDPTGSWYKNKIDADGADTVWADFPMVGFNKNWIVAQVTMFTNSNNFFSRSRIYMFNKTNVYAGGNSRVVTNLPRSLNSFQAPAVTYDNSISTLYLLQTWNSDFTNSSSQLRGALRLYRITGSPSSPVLSATTNYPTTQPWAYWPGGRINFAPQSNTTVKMMVGDSRIQNVVYRNGYLWSAQTVFLPRLNPTRCSIQWWQITPGTGNVPQAGRLDDSAGIKFFAFPSIAVNRFSDVLIGYSRFSTNQFASANYVFRNFDDTLSSLGTDTVLKTGEGVYYKTFNAGENRWGDYSASMTDPVNDIDFWTIQQYAATPVGTGFADNDGRWGTWWGRVPIEVPINDYFTNALAINGSAGSVTNTNLRATKETGEPNHAGNSGGKSLWYTWTAPNNGQATISTIGSTFNTTLAIYTGTAVSSLTTVTNDNDSGGSLTSRAVFTAVSNTTYKIAVDGLNGVSGTVVVNWSQPAPPMILAQPESTNVVANANENAIFSVTAVGNPVPSCQWRFNGTNITSATGSSYTITNVQSSHAGDYTVVCTNTSGSITSVVATLFIHGDSAARLNLIDYKSGSFWFQIYGLTNRPYRVETTTNLTAPITWTSVTTNYVSYFYTNFAMTNDVMRFYRAITNSP